MMVRPAAGTYTPRIRRVIRRKGGGSLRTVAGGIRLPLNEAEKLPDDPNELARIVADDKEDAGRQNQALEKLQPTIWHLAMQVDNRFGGQFGSEFIEGAVTYYWERRQLFDPDQGSFVAWCWRILRNGALDLMRRRGTERNRTPQASQAMLDNEPAAIEASPEAREAADAAVKEVARERRACLDQLSWSPASANVTDLFAVVLLHLRLAMAGRISEFFEGERPPDKMAYLLAQCLPWRRAEEALQFKPSWPTLHRIWAALAVHLNRPPYRVSIANFCDLLTKLLDGKATVTRDVWYHWVKRAKAIARGRIPPEDWELFFAEWFPDRGPKPGDLPGSAE